MSAPGPRVRVVIVNYNGAELTAQCMASLLKQTWVPFDIVVVDDHSPSEDWEKLQKLQKLLPGAAVLHRTGQSSGYARCINAGTRLQELPQAEFTLAMNNDVLLPDRDTIRKLVEALLDDSRRAAASPLIHHVGVKAAPEAAVQVRRVPNFSTLLIAHSSILRRIPIFKTMIDGYTYADARPYRSGEVVNCESINGALFLIRTDFLREIGYLDEHTFLYMEELILGAQIQQAGRTGCLVASTTVDHLQGSATLSTPSRFRLRMFLAQVDSELYYLRRYLAGGVVRQIGFVCVRFGDALARIVHTQFQRLGTLRFLGLL